MGEYPTNSDESFYLMHLIYTIKERKNGPETKISAISTSGTSGIYHQMPRNGMSISDHIVRYSEREGPTGEVAE